ncbi:MAG: hypothetical protein J5857_05310 [Treponema sp.]|nr:hypothetical protein [Treponema sp.]
MKKLISIFAVFTLAVCSGLAQSASDLFAQNETVSITSTGNTGNSSAETPAMELPEELLDALKKPWENAESISQLTAGYTVGEKNTIYNEFEKSKGKAIGLNWLGFGIGSFTQGDGLGGGLGLTFDLLGYGSMLVGGGMFIVGVVILPWVAIAEGAANGSGSGSGSESGTSSGELEALLNAGIGLFATGCILWLGNRIFGTIRPICFQNKYNNSLKAALGINDTEVSFVPVIDPIKSQYGLLTHITF